MKKKKEREEDKNQAREPLEAYQKNTLRFFSSFEEQEEYELNEMARANSDAAQEIYKYRLWHERL